MSLVYFCGGTEWCEQHLEIWVNSRTTRDTQVASLAYIQDQDWIVRWDSHCKDYCLLCKTALCLQAVEIFFWDIARTVRYCSCYLCRRVEMEDYIDESELIDLPVVSDLEIAALAAEALEAETSSEEVCYHAMRVLLYFVPRSSVHLLFPSYPEEESVHLNKLWTLRAPYDAHL